MSRHLRSPIPNARGMALVAVLWIVAALSILVTGVVQAQRNEIRVVSSARHAVQASAQGQAAMQLVLQALAARTQPVARLERVPVAFGGQAMEVEVMPLNGLIDLNRAPAPLLAVLFEVGGQLDPDRASALAQAVVAARVPVPGAPAGPRFEAVEDLLQLPGVDYDLYARLTRLVTTDSAGSGRVNAMAAPAEVLRVLSRGDAGLAERIAAARDAGQAGVDTTALPAAFLDNAAATRFRLVARVAMGDGRRLASTRLVDLGRVGRDGVPWRVFHAEEQFEPMPATMN